MSLVWKYSLNLERTSSQLFSDWSSHCCQASSLVLQECVDQSERLNVGTMVKVSWCCGGGGEDKVLQ